METSQRLKGTNCQTLIASSGDFPVRRLVKQGLEADSRMSEERCFSTSCEYLKSSDLACLCLKTSKGYSRMTVDELTKPSSPRLQSWGIASNGSCSTARISACHSTGSVSSLSDILEKGVPSKYFLSARRQKRIGELLPVGRDYSHKDCVYVPDGTKAGHAVAKLGDAVNLAYIACKNKRGRVGHGISQTLTANTMSLHTPVRSSEGKLVLRRLTPKECERLQGFPDDWTKTDKDGKTVSETQRYKMCGNAVTTNVVQAVFERILERLIERLVAPSCLRRNCCAVAKNELLRDKTDRAFTLSRTPSGKGGAQ